MDSERDGEDKFDKNDGLNDGKQKFSLKGIVRDLGSAIKSGKEAISVSHQREKIITDQLAICESNLTAAKEDTNTLKGFLDAINQCEKMMERVENISDLLVVGTLFEELKENYYGEYQVHRLWNLAVPVLHAYIKQYISSNCNTLTDNHNDELVKLFLKWKPLLEDGTSDSASDNKIPSKENMDPYHQLIWDVWMPFLREAIVEWNPREPDLLVGLIGQWKNCLPESILNNIFDELIYPKLNHEVDLWNPGSDDSAAIYKLLDPWLPLLEDRIKALYQSIETKSAEA